MLVNHCHIVLHEDNGLVQTVEVAPGRSTVTTVRVTGSPARDERGPGLSNLSAGQSGSGVLTECDLRRCESGDQADLAWGRLPEATAVRLRS